MNIFWQIYLWRMFVMNDCDTFFPQNFETILFTSHFLESEYAKQLQSIVAARIYSQYL